MSVEKLKLKTPVGTSVDFAFDKQGDLWITIKEMQQFVIDHSQAHLLMLYLQEHLNGNEKFWYCPKCDKEHAVDYICERISS